MNSNGPIATPRNVLQKLPEEQTKDENFNVKEETKVANQSKGKIELLFCYYFYSNEIYL